MAPILSMTTLTMTTAIPFSQQDVLWMLIVGFIFSFILAFGLGANDVANSFATSVGSKVLTLFQACILASIFETGGAVLLGSKVSDTIRKGIFDVTLYEGKEETLMLGQVAALGGAMIWLLIATGLKLPVSGTHSIVGAMVGFHLVVFQFEGINAKQLIMIVASWFVSPLMSGILSAIIFATYRYFVLQKVDPLKNGLRALPVCYAAVMFVNFLSIFFHAPQMLRLDRIPTWAGALISIVIACVVGLCVWLFVIPRVKKSLGLSGGSEAPRFTIGGANTEQVVALNMNTNNSNGTAKTSTGLTAPTDESTTIEYSPDVSIEETGSSSPAWWPFKQTPRGFYRSVGNSPSSAELVKGRKMSKRDTEEWKQVKDPQGVAEICGPLQILSALFASFAHGGNDVSNAIGPLIALWAIFQSGEVDQKQASPIWILLYGGVGMTIGLWVLGRRVIETVGSNLTPLTPSSGFTIELGAATTVLVASNLGIPVSTTHCKVGSIIAIGYVRSKANVDWKVFRSIILAWGITVPCAALLSAGLMWLMMFFIA